MSGLTSASQNVSKIDIDIRFIGRLIITFFRLMLGAWMIVSGWNHVGPLLGFPYVFPQPLGNFHLSSVMLVSLIEVGLFDLVKIVEVLAGLCLMFNRFVPLAVAVSLPVSYMVFHNSIVLNLRYERLFSTYMSVWCLYMNVILCLAYFKYFLPMLKFKAPVGELRDLKEVTTIFQSDDKR
jgi:hypothetical protein